MAVTMSDLNKRIATLEGVAPKTPITMKGLADRLAQVEATAKKWEIVDINFPEVYNGTSYGYYDKKYDGWSYAVISFSFSSDSSRYPQRISLSFNGTSASGSFASNKSSYSDSFPIGRGSGYFTISAGQYYSARGSMKVLFYK